MVSELTTLTATGAAAGVTSTSGLHGSLGLDVALGGAGSGLVDSLDGNVGLVLAIFVVAYYLEKAVVSDAVAIIRVGSIVSVHRYITDAQGWACAYIYINIVERRERQIGGR